jgi:hypothetical protein
VCYFYKGFSDIVLEKTKNKILAKKWDKLFIADMIASIDTLIILIGGIFVEFPFPFNSILFKFVLSFAVCVYLIVLGILKVIYIFKTARALS